jgi:hypothetical protein
MTLLNLLGRVVQPASQNVTQKLTPIAKKVVQASLDRQKATKTAPAVQSAPKVATPEKRAISTGGQQVKALLSGDMPTYERGLKEQSLESFIGKYDVATPEMIKQYREIDALFATGMQKEKMIKERYESATGQDIDVNARKALGESGEDFDKLKIQEQKDREELALNVPPLILAQREMKANEYDFIIDMFTKTDDYKTANPFMVDADSLKADLSMPSLSVQWDALEKTKRIKEDAKAQFEALSPRRQLNLSLNALEKKITMQEEAEKEMEWQMIEDVMRDANSVPLGLKVIDQLSSAVNTMTGRGYLNKDESTEGYKKMYDLLSESDKKMIQEKVKSQNEIASIYREAEAKLDYWETGFWETDKGRDRKNLVLLREVLATPNQIGEHMAEGFLWGISMGTSGVISDEMERRERYSMGGFTPNPYSTIPEVKALQQTVEVVGTMASFASTFGGGAVLYTGMARQITKIFNKIPKIGTTLAKAPVAVTYLARNVIETGVETVVKKATGQEWGVMDVFLDLAFGTLVETGMARKQITKALKEKKAITELENKFLSAEVKAGKDLSTKELTKVAEGDELFQVMALAAEKKKGKKLTPKEKDAIVEDLRNRSQWVKAEEKLVAAEQKKGALLTDDEVAEVVGEVKVGGKTINQISEDLNRVGMETPSIKDFNKYKAKYPDLELKGVDDMKLIRSKESGEVVGIQNRAGDKRMFETPKVAKAVEATKALALKETDVQMKVRGLSKSISEKAISEGIFNSSILKELPEYKVRHKETFTPKMDKFIREDYERAVRIGMREEAIPENVDFLTSEVYVAVSAFASAINDVATMRKLALHSGLLEEATQAGRFTSAFNDINPYSTTSQISKIQKRKMSDAVRQELGESKGRIADLEAKVKELQKQVGAKLDAKKKTIKVRTIDAKRMQEFIHNITC